MVSCSGGADSTALFHTICQLAKAEENFQVAIFHAAYGLRGEESEADFRFVEALARDFSVPLFVRRVSDEERAARRGESLQEWARRLRYEEFARLAADGWAIALGHHLDDQAETVLMRLARGTSPETLLGMRDWRAPYWRPFLRERKAAILAYLDRHALPFREDSSNDKADYSRNVVRQRVLPELEALFPGAAARIVACAEAAANEGDDTDAKRTAIARYVRANAPTVPLSRRFLAEAASRLDPSEPGRSASQGPELPHSDLRLTRLEDGSLALVPDQGGLKADRVAQHQRGVRSAFRPAALLEPDSYASFRRSGEQWVLETSLTKTPSRAPVRLESRPALPDDLRGFGSIPKAERGKWQILQQDGQSLGLYDGTRLILPIDRGI